MITNAALHYSPDEVEFYLIDFKKGVEFKTYATHRLPHARVIAVESDREFGVSVLQAIQAELAWRGSLLRGSESHSSLETLRRATGERLPRINVRTGAKEDVLVYESDVDGELAVPLHEFASAVERVDHP